jgi:hypothetical protein
MKPGNKKYRYILFSSIIVFQLIFTTGLTAQESGGKNPHHIFSRIEEGIADGTVDKFSNYFSSKNYISLSNGTAGYYSSNQSYYVIKDFLSICIPSSFKLLNIVTETKTPFASGVLKYTNKGIRKTATVFVTLQMVDNQWCISQITIN